MFSFQLPKQFVDNYRVRPVNFGWNGLGKVTFYRTYSRTDNPNVDGQETWADVCERVINGMYTIQKNNVPTRRWNDEKAMSSAMEAFDLMFNFKWTPPGRGLWMMGTPFIHERHEYAALQNCFDPKTEYTTLEYGVTSLADTVGQEVTVWTEKGWQRGFVKSFGEQQTQRITFRPSVIKGKGFGSFVIPLRSNYRKVVNATPDHRWMLVDGRITTTLSVGDNIPSEYMAPSPESEEYRKGIAHGLVFGDGVKITHEYRDGTYGFELRCCSERKQNVAASVAEQFDKLYDNRPSANGDPIYYKRSPINLKMLPETNDPEYIAGFIEGWLWADSSVTPTGSVKLSTQNPEAKSWIQKYAAYAGFSVTGIHTDNRPTQYGQRSHELYLITLRNAQDVVWQVESIEQDIKQEVMCAVVPTTGTFTLSGGMLTGNCAFASTKNIAQEGGNIFRWFMEKLMLGVGVGFDTRGAGKIVPEWSQSDFVYVVDDTRESWAESIAALVDSYLYGGPVPRFDYSRIRPKGAPIKGFGGVASGPEPLMHLHTEVEHRLFQNCDKPITSTTIADIFNLIGACVVAGNVRRSAEIALGSPFDTDFINLKNYELNPHRAGYGWTSNNSVMIEDGMDVDYRALAKRTYDNGEPGYYWIDNARNYGRMNGVYEPDSSVMGANPCLEQVLGDKEMCTLSEIHLPNCNTKHEFVRAIKYGYLYGKTATLLSPHLEDESADIMSQNRRIGLSVTGHTQFIGKHGIDVWKDWMDHGYHMVAGYYDKLYSQWMDVPVSVRKTSVKPSGTISLVSGVTPGIHYNVAGRYHIRRLTLASDSKILASLQRAGYPVEPSAYSRDSYVVEFPVDAGEGVKSESEVSMQDQLTLAAAAQELWADNAVSATVKFDRNNVSVDDLASAIKWSSTRLKGISFLPLEDHGYEQAPYESITKERYYEMMEGIDIAAVDGVIGNDKMMDMYCDGEACVIPVNRGK